MCVVFEGWFAGPQDLELIVLGNSPKIGLKVNMQMWDLKVLKYTELFDIDF